MTTKGEQEMPKKSSYQKDLIESLKDPCEAAAYLNAAIEEGDRAVFLLALRNVAEASGGMAALAKKANVSRESLYRTLSKRGNPEIKSLYTLLHAMGLRLAVEAEPHTCEAA
jgi:probable addiction module antidote protein